MRRCLKNYKETGSVLRRAGSGRPKATSNREERHLKQLCLKNRFETAGELRAELQSSSSVNVSVRTVRRRFNEFGLMARRPSKKPLLTRKMKEKRLIWSKERKLWTENDWARIIFSVESKFNLFDPDGTATVRRRKGERYSDECLLRTVKHSPYLMVWGAITSKGVGQILFITGSVNARKYQDIIDEGVIPTLEQLSEDIGDMVFQDDSAPCYRARSLSIQLLHRKTFYINQLHIGSSYCRLQNIRTI